MFSVVKIVKFYFLSDNVWDAEKKINTHFTSFTVSLSIYRLLMMQKIN